MVSIIIPFKYDSQNRIENILELCAYARKYWSFDEMFIIEMDESPKIINLLPDWCKYIFVKEIGNVWSRSKRINMALPMIKSKVTIILDSDVLIDWEHIEYILNKIKKNELDAATPFNDLYHVQRNLIIEEMKKNKVEICSFLDKNKDKISRVFKTNGACFITRTDIFKHLRGMNELFFGWGLEDDELITRYAKLGFRYGRSNGQAIHINHERTPNCSPDPDNFLGSITEKNRINLFSKEEIMNYYGIRENVGVYNSLDKPIGADNATLLDMVNKEKSLYFNQTNELYKI